MAYSTLVLFYDFVSISSFFFLHNNKCERGRVKEKERKYRPDKDSERTKNLSEMFKFVWISDISEYF